VRSADEPAGLRAAIVLIVGIHLFVSRSYVGKAIRARPRMPDSPGDGINTKRSTRSPMLLVREPALADLIGMTFSFVPPTPDLAAQRLCSLLSWVHGQYHRHTGRALFSGGRGVGGAIGGGLP